jgi:hypothetical protein
MKVKDAARVEGDALVGGSNSLAELRDVEVFRCGSGHAGTASFLGE